MKPFVIYLFLCLLALTACQKDKDSNPGGNSGADAEQLSPDELAILDAQPEFQSLDLSEILLPNGFSVAYYLKDRDSVFYDMWRGNPPVCESPVSCKNLLVAKLMTVGLFLTLRSNFQYPEGSSDEPAQNGLAYSFGSKDYSLRQRPPSGGCTDKLYGLDCSGFMYQLFKQAGVSTFPNGPADLQRKPETIKKALEQAYPDWNNILVLDKGKLPADSLQSGDLIYWTHSDGIAFHEGIVLKGHDGKLGVFQSNGYGGNDSDTSQCKKNYGPNRGPRLFKLTQLNIFGNDYGVVRIIANPYEWYIQQSLTTKVVQSPDGVKWAASSDGLFRFDGTDWTNYTTVNSNLPNDFIVDIAVDAGGAVWMATFEGLAVLTNGSWTIYNMDNSPLPSNSIDCIFIDRDNVKWICVSGMGIFRLNGGSWDRIAWKDNTYYYSTNHIVTDLSGNVWISTSDGLAMYDGSSWTEFTLPGTMDNFVNSITIDRNNLIWVGTSEGLMSFDGGWSVFNTTNSPLTSDFVTAVTFDEGGNAWIGTIGLNSGLSKIENGNTWKHFNFDHGNYPFVNVQGILVDGNQNIWQAGNLGLTVLFQE